MQNKLINSSMMKQSLQTSFLLQKIDRLSNDCDFHMYVHGTHLRGSLMDILVKNLLF